MDSTIGISTWSLQQATYLYDKNIYDLIEAVAEMGVDGLDYYGDYIPCYPKLDWMELRAILKKCDECNLPIMSTWFMSDICSAVAASSMEKALELGKYYLAVSAECRARWMTLPFIFAVPGMTMEEHYETLLRYLERILPVAEEYRMPIAHELPRQQTPAMALRLKRALQSDFYTLCPDLEAWRLETEDFPLVHAENPDDKSAKPESLDLFRECLPHSPLIHYKLLALDENGEEPHFPIAGIMRAINESPIVHHLAVEYEGWIPDLFPERDAIAETRRCVEMIRRYRR